MEPTFFEQPAYFRHWLEAHHANHDELLVGFYKKRSRRASMTWPEAVDQGLCFGWIDRVRRSLDQDSYTIRLFFRSFYAIVALIIHYAMGIVISCVSFVSWFAIVVTARQPASLQNALRFALSYTTRADALIFLITETYPPFGEGDIPSVQPAI